MEVKGSFGYKFGKRVRLMYVESDGNLLWQILVREIYVLMKHFGTIENVRELFLNLKNAKGKIKKEMIEELKIYTDLKLLNETKEEWSTILRYCQHSFINILESGYFLNNGNEEIGPVLLLDFNTNSVLLYHKNNKKEIKICEKATIDEIMEFEDMPTKQLKEITEEMKNKFTEYNNNVEKLKLDEINIELSIRKAKELGSDQNIIQKAKKMLDKLKLEKSKIDMSYRVFYNRLDALNLIDHNL